jgi:hypothetical protein
MGHDMRSDETIKQMAGVQPEAKCEACGRPRSYCDAPPDRVAALRAWAESRIAALDARRGWDTGLDAFGNRIERTTLQKVLRMLDGATPTLEPCPACGAVRDADLITCLDETVEAVRRPTERLDSCVARLVRDLKTLEAERARICTYINSHLQDYTNAAPFGLGTVRTLREMKTRIAELEAAQNVDSTPASTGEANEPDVCDCLVCVPGTGETNREPTEPKAAGPTARLNAEHHLRTSKQVLTQMQQHKSDAERYLAERDEARAELNGYLLALRRERTRHAATEAERDKIRLERDIARAALEKHGIYIK